LGVGAITNNEEGGEMITVSDCIGCVHFPCEDVRHEKYIIPQVKLDPEIVSVILISEASPPDLGDYYYAEGDPLLSFQRCGY
jgi:hypothetical protein